MYTPRTALPPAAQFWAGRIEERRRSGHALWVAAVRDEAGGAALEKAGADLLFFHPDYAPSPETLLESLRPLGNANDRMLAALPRILKAVGTGVFAGVCGSDPFLLRGPFFEALLEMGPVGVFNFPTLGLLDGVFRANLEESGIRFNLEMEMLSAGRTAGLASMALAFDLEQASQAATFGSEFIVIHPGLEIRKGALRPTSAREARDPLRALLAAVKSKNPATLCLLHADSLEDSDMAAGIWREMDNLDGFFISQSAERLSEMRSTVEKSRV